MKKQISSLYVPIIVSVFLFFIFNNFHCFAEDYPGKWYGWHCPLVNPADETDFDSPAAFQEQKVVEQWGYQGKPIEKIKDLLPKSFYDIVNNEEAWGPIRINETAYIPKDQWPGVRQKAVIEATKKYKGRAFMDEKGHIQNYMAGIPFPGTEDPVKIAWNFVKAFNWGQTLWADYATAIVDRKGHMRFSVASILNFTFNGRLFGAQKPLYEPNPNNYELLTCYGFKAPYDLLGTVILNYRYDDPDKEDDAWIYIPPLRRIRRMSTAQRWDKLPGGNDIAYDNATGFYGKPTNYQWKYLGRKKILCGHNSSYELQMLKDKPGGGVNDKQYQRVNTVVLEYVPKISATISKGIMYLDPETYHCYYCENYDKRGRLWIVFNHVWNVHENGHKSPSSYLVADVQRTHSSSNYTYNLWQDLNAETIKDLKPEFLKMINLRKIFGGR